MGCCYPMTTESMCELRVYVSKERKESFFFFLKPVMVYLLQCGKWVKLQLAESTPNLLEIGSNQDEAKKLLQDHELLLTKLKVRSDKATQKYMKSL